MIVALAGGVGGAKLAQGLYGVVPAGALTVVVNTADDFTHLGLHIAPDLDTVLYTLAGIANPATGWGIAGDSFEAMAMLGRYGHDDWFRLGDRDLATHITRTERLRAGASISQVTADLAARLGVTAQLLPMCDEPVATLVDTAVGRLAFQDYFVRRHHQDDVLGLVFEGAAVAHVPAAVATALAEADAIVLCPSNPFVSIGPILAVPGLRDRLAAATVPRVAVSPIVGGQAVKGPAGQMLAALGHDVSPLGVARLYTGLIDGIVIDEIDAALAPAIAALGLAVLPAQTVMGDTADRERLARDVLGFCRRLAERVRAPA
ncbi:MAG: 2-phospho-L-lactate transferase [Chloroflexi bacterium]|nr:2-phospho-L-lactate transferase [Chloroflexota bacterium]